MTRSLALAALTLIVAGRALAQVPEGYVEYGVYASIDPKHEAGWRVLIGKSDAMLGYRAADRHYFGIVVPKGTPAAGITFTQTATWSDGTTYDGKSDWTGVKGTFDGSDLRIEGTRIDLGSYFSKPANAQVSATMRQHLKVHLTLSASGACKVEGGDEDLEDTTKFSTGRVDKNELGKRSYNSCVKLSK